jgi:hypothetical protein
MIPEIMDADLIRRRGRARGEKHDSEKDLQAQEDGDEGLRAHSLTQFLHQHR